MAAAAPYFITSRREGAGSPLLGSSSKVLMAASPLLVIAFRRLLLRNSRSG
jgi:hypothetical protein